MITVTLQGATVSAIQDQMRTFLVGALLNPKAISQEKVHEILTEASDTAKECSPVGSTSDSAEPSEPVHNYAEPEAAPVVEKEKKTRTRKPKEEKAEAPIEAAPKAEVETKKPAADIPIVVAGKESVHQALQQVNVAIGLNKAREILAEFKINRISEIKPDQYKAFVDKCNEAVMMHG